MSFDPDPAASCSDSSASLAPNEVALWILDHRWSGSEPFQALQSHVSEDERRHAAGYSDARVRGRSLLDRGFLRAVLAQYVARSPAAIPIARTSFGKPYVADPSADGLRFNMSHSGEVTLVAVAFGLEIGIDVERVRHDVWLEEVAQMYFSPSELEALAGLPDVQQRLAFFTIWVRKEALIKAWGQGISPALLRALHVGAGPVTEIAREGRSWCLQHLDIDSGYVAALAAAGDAWRVVRRAPGALFAAAGQCNVVRPTGRALARAGAKSGQSWL